MSDRTNTVNWFEIPVVDFDRAVEFYQHVFAVTLTLNTVGAIRMAWFPMSRDAPGASGSLMQADGYEPSEIGAVVYFAVASVDDALRRAEERGGQVLVPATSIGAHGIIAHVRDSEGNRIGIHGRR
jgi:predicted enzyme related to lactoylglutathione lyase